MNLRRRLLSTVFCGALSCALFGATGLAAPPPVSAEPAAGAALPSARDVVVSDLADRPLRLSEYAGRVVVVVHEDKEANQQNKPLKDALGKVLAAHRGKLIVVALADVSRYDYWPARGFVLKALRKLPQEEGAVVLADWKGALRQRLGLRRGESSVLVLGRDGGTAMLRRGDLSKADADALLAQVGSAAAAP